MNKKENRKNYSLFNWGILLCSTRQRMVFRTIWLFLLWISITGLVIYIIFNDVMTWIDKQGFIHEPFLIILLPCYFLLALSLIMAVIDIVSDYLKNRPPPSRKRE